VVVVLGDTGRNFADGMSGGISYVDDPTNRFDPLCNNAMVEIEAIAPASSLADPDDAQRPRQKSVSVDDNGMGDVLAFDAERLRILIERHQLYTGSARARMILENWDAELANFRKVMPSDYRRALLDLAQERKSAAAVAAE
ncbi:MAG: hypothetical protein Q8M38_02960, partial [Phenylobacterium sp.]|nr:hypothetical protein [Phenylobacterium sp.]